jgi:hypothetical protein
MKISKKIRKYIGLGLIVLTLVTSIVGYKKHEAKVNAINSVKNIKSNINKDITLDKAYSKYIQKLNYTYYKDSEENQFVEINGKVLLKDKNRVADMRVTYLVDGDNTKFYSMYLDKMKMTEIDYLILKVKAFGSYDSTNL